MCEDRKTETKKYVLPLATEGPVLRKFAENNLNTNLYISCELKEPREKVQTKLTHQQNPEEHA